MKSLMSYRKIISLIACFASIEFQSMNLLANVQSTDSSQMNASFNIYGVGTAVTTSDNNSSTYNAQGTLQGTSDQKMTSYSATDGVPGQLVNMGGQGRDINTQDTMNQDGSMNVQTENDSVIQGVTLRGGDVVGTNQTASGTISNPNGTSGTASNYSSSAMINGNMDQTAWGNDEELFQPNANGGGTETVTASRNVGTQNALGQETGGTGTTTTTSGTVASPGGSFSDSASPTTNVSQNQFSFINNQQMMTSSNTSGGTAGASAANAFQSAEAGNIAAAAAAAGTAMNFGAFIKAMGFGQ